MQQPPPYGTRPYAVHQNQPYGGGAPPPYGSPQMSSSLGTPHIPMWNRSSPAERSWAGTKEIAPSASSVVLVPTRPLLKSLARECKPSPPWCVGSPMTGSMSDEILLFAYFLTMTENEQEHRDALLNTVEACLQRVWPEAKLNPTGLNAAGVYPPKDATLHAFLAGSEQFDGTEQELRAQLVSAANQDGFQADFCIDYRGCSTILLTEARMGDRVSVRFGPKAELARQTADLLCSAIAGNPTRRAVLVALDALMRQNRVIDDSGANPSLLCGEALAVMLLAIAKSYSEDDIPDAGRLLIDFFLTYGFPAHFDNAASSITSAGMAQAVPKIHKDAQLSVIDPSDETANLTPKVERIAHILAVFNYCYTAISQFAQTTAGRHKAQSALSTIIGGEAYWGRVLSLYHQKIEPFFSVVEEKRAVLGQQRF